jgi:hypothetical protein
MLWIKPRDELLTRKQLVIAMTPAQTRQIIDHGLGQVPVSVILHHTDRAMALGEFFTVWP